MAQPNFVYSERMQMYVPELDADVANAMEVRDQELEDYLGQLATTVNGLPLGVLDYAQVTANQTGITAITDLTGLDVTWTAETTRYYKLSAYCFFSQNAAAGRVIMRLATSGGTGVQDWQEDIAAAGQRGSAYPTVILTGLSGSVTYKARLDTNAGNVDLLASGGGPAWIMVEDIGVPA